MRKEDSESSLWENKTNFGRSESRIRAELGI